jgi:predicted cobalt transporter CbtA
MGKITATAPPVDVASGARPDHFSTYVPREVVRRLKVVATIRDVPLWVVVTAALQSYLEAFQQEHGRLPALDDPAEPRRE